MDPFKSEIAMIPEVTSAFAEATHKLRSITETRIQFQSKPNLSSFRMMSKVAKAYKNTHEEVVKIDAIWNNIFVRTRLFNSNALIIFALFSKLSWADII